MFVAPVVEEILKALILVYLVRRPNFTYFVDGAIYGFAAGMGFAVFENYEYILQTRTPGWALAISRVLSTNLVHASASALVGVALGLSRFRRRLGKSGLLLGGLLAAMLLHMAFNNVVTGRNPRADAALLGGDRLGAAGLIAFSIFRGLAEEKAVDRGKAGHGRPGHRGRKPASCTACPMCRISSSRWRSFWRGKGRPDRRVPDDAGAPGHPAQDAG